MLLTPRELLQATVGLYRKEFWLLLGYASWLLVPVAAFYFATSLPKNPVTAVLIIVTVVLQLFVWLWIIICLMRATAALLSGKAVDQNALSTQALRRIQPVLAVAFLQALILLGGLLLLVVPAVVFWVWYSLAQVAAALDDKRPIESLTYSRALVAGRFWLVLWRLLAGPAVIGLFYAFLSGSIILAVAAFAQADPTAIFGPTPPLWSELIQSIVDIFFIPLFVVYSVLLFQDLQSHPVEKAAPVA